MLCTKHGGGGGGDGVCRLHCTKLNINWGRMNMGHMCARQSRTLQMRSKRGFSTFWNCSLMIVLCCWKSVLQKFSNELVNFCGLGGVRIWSCPYLYLCWRMCSAYAHVKISIVGKWKILMDTKINQTHSMPRTLSCMIIYSLKIPDVC